MPKLYNIHCGFYDKSVTGGLFEGHTNILVVAEDFADAKAKVKSKAEFNIGSHGKMHTGVLANIRVPLALIFLASS